MDYQSAGVDLQDQNMFNAKLAAKMPWIGGYAGAYDIGDDYIVSATDGIGTKINHLTYVGDATIGKSTNIGAGTITCNYDGKRKYRTNIRDKVFIGSNSSLVAPVTIGKKSFIGAGSVITKNVREKSLALTRSKQVEKKNYKKN